MTRGRMPFRRAHALAERGCERSECLPASVATAPTRTAAPRARSAGPRAAPGRSPRGCRRGSRRSRTRRACPTGIVKAGYSIACPTISASTIPTGIPSAAPISAVMMLSWRIIRRSWRRRHADRAQHAELARALEDGQHERVDDPEQADDDRQREQHVEQVQAACRSPAPGCLELALGLDLRVREARERAFQPARVRGV